MIELLEAFIRRHDSFILTTHDSADADGLGAEMVIACILRERKKSFRIINASPVPDNFRFMDPGGLVEEWDENKHGALPEKSAVIVIDTADLNHIGDIKEAVLRSREIFVIDHHELPPGFALAGISDPCAASSCELAIELAEAAGVVPDGQAAFAAYTGIVYDTGFFAHSKTGLRTFKAAVTLLNSGVNPNEVHSKLCLNSPAGTLALQKKAFESLTIHCRGRVASQVLRKKDFTETDTGPDDTEGFVNFPMKSREIVVSILLKETPNGKVKCSLRSKGTVNVAEVAHKFGGGGHVNASGFKSEHDTEKTLAMALDEISRVLETP